MTTVAIIGAGMAGLSCARALSAAGNSVRVFEKSGDIGGRLATRRRDGRYWNHGAPFVEVRSEAFKGFLDSLRSAGNARAVRLPRGLGFRGVPDMRELLRSVAADLPMTTGVEVSELDHAEDGWWLSVGDDSHGPFERLVLAIPGPQASALLDRSSLGVDGLSEVRMNPAWSLLLSVSNAADVLDRLPLDGVVESITREPSGQEYVVRFGADWSSERIEQSRQDMVPVLLHTLRSRLPEGASLAEPTAAMAHRWRYAEVASPLGEFCIWQSDTQMGLCGDWCLGAYAEHAHMSGQALAQVMLDA